MIEGACTEPQSGRSVEKSNSLIVPNEMIEAKIFFIRGKKVMLDKDIALLYHVGTKVLIQSVKRNLSRFPLDFMFQLTAEEALILRSQFVTSTRGGRRYLPYAFTEQGVAMLSSVLRSERAIQVNIQIMRIFNKLREMLMRHQDLKRKIEEMEKKYDNQFKIVFDALRGMFSEKEKPKVKIGFLRDRG